MSPPMLMYRLGISCRAIPFSRYMRKSHRGSPAYNVNGVSWG